MPRTREHSQPTRQLYATIREDIYLAAKAKATELRLPLRRFIEDALELAIAGGAAAQAASETPAQVAPAAQPSVWDDQYLAAQARQPLGAPVELSADEARRVALSVFQVGNAPERAQRSERRSMWAEERLQRQAQRAVGDPVDLSDEDAAKIARAAFAMDDFGADAEDEVED